MSASEREYKYTEESWNGQDSEPRPASERSHLLLQHRHSSLFGTLLSAQSLYDIYSKQKSRRRHSKIGKAAFLIRDAILGDNVENPSLGAYDPYLDESQIYRNLVSVYCRRLCTNNWVIRILWMAIWIQISLGFLEPPHWCRANDCQELFQEGVVATDDKSEESTVDYLYPSTGTLILSVAAARRIEILCVSTILVILLLRVGRDGMSLQRYFRPSSVQNNRILQAVFVGILIFGEILGTTAFHNFVRLGLLFSFLRDSQREIETLWGLLPDVFNVLLLLLIVTIFYAWFGVVMFVDTDEGDLLFPNLIEDVMMPGYNQNRWVALYFISFMVITFFFLMNVILASVVNEYDQGVQRQREEHETNSSENLIQAYQLLAEEESKLHTPNKDSIDRSTVMELFTILNDDFPEVRKLSTDETNLLFAVLDKDGSSKITQDEFMDFGNVMLLEFVKASEYATFVELHYPKFYEGPFWKRFRETVNSAKFEYFIDFVLVLNAVVVAIQSWPELTDQTVKIDQHFFDGSIDTVWELVETIFTGIYLVEIICKVAVLGWKLYFDSARNVFDFGITMLATVTSVIVYYPNAYSDSRLIRMILVVRVLRLMRLLTALKPFQLLGRVSAVILPASTSVFMVLFVVLYFFAALGMLLYGGMITRDPDNPLSHLLLHTDFSDSEYWANNFNDMFSGMNVLFNLLVVNNWFVCEIGFEAVTEGKWCRLFFLAFHVIGVILVNNLVIAFVINKFLEELAIYREHTNAELVGETMIRDRLAVFDATTVTGTKTGVGGKYMARLKHADSDHVGADHHHDRLRTLFTQTSSLENSSNLDSSNVRASSVRSVKE